MQLSPLGGLTVSSQSRESFSSDWLVGYVSSVISTFWYSCSDCLAACRVQLEVSDGTTLCHKSVGNTDCSVHVENLNWNVVICCCCYSQQQLHSRGGIVAWSETLYIYCYWGARQSSGNCRHKGRTWSNISSVAWPWWWVTGVIPLLILAQYQRDKFGNISRAVFSVEFHLGGSHFVLRS